MSDHEFSMVPYRFSTKTMDINIYATANETDQNNWVASNYDLISE